MALGSLTENERYCLDSSAKSQMERLQDTEKPLNGDCKPNCLRVRFLDEEGKTERMVSADECDYAVSRVKKIHILKNRSSSETSIMLRNPSLLKRRSSMERRLSDGLTDNLNNNSLNENLNERITMFKISEFDELDKTENGLDKAKELNTHSFKKNCNVYSVDQAKTLTPEKKKSNPLVIPKIMTKSHESKSILPAEVCLADGAHGKDFRARTFGRLSRGLGRLLRRTNSVRISEPDPTYKVAYLGNVLTGWAKGESCVEKPLSTLWRNYQQTSKPDVVMKLSVTNSGLKGFTKEHGLTEYWSHRITYCASSPQHPKLFCWVYRHEGKKLKHELRCHAVLCTKESVSKKITEELQVKLKQALVEFKKDRISKQNARLSLANSVYDNPSMPRRKIMLSVGAMNYRPPLERSKSAPKLGAIEELCSEEDEEEAEMKTKDSICDTWINSLPTNSDIKGYYSPTLYRRRPETKSPRKLSCPEGMINVTQQYCNDITSNVTDDVIDILVKESDKTAVEHKRADSENSFKLETRLAALESIAESNEIKENSERKDLKLTPQSNFLVTDSDDGSVSSGCETASTVTSSDVEPSSLPSQFPSEEIQKEHSDSDETIFDSMESIEQNTLRESTKCYSDSTDFLNSPGDETYSTEASNEVNHVPIGEKNVFRRRSTYPPLGEVNLFTKLEDNFESLIDNLCEVDSLTLSAEADVFKSAGDNDSACSDESGYSELLDTAKDSIIGSTIMV